MKSLNSILVIKSMVDYGFDRIFLFPKQKRSRNKLRDRGEYDRFGQFLLLL